MLHPSPPFHSNQLHCMHTETQRSERMMGGGPETRVLSNASTESLLGRLNQIDIRLRQLERQQQQQRFSPESSYFIDDLQTRHQPCKSLSSALHEAHLKGTLMDRLHLLECRIRQLSHELDKESVAVSSSAAAKKLANDQNMWLQQIEEEEMKQQDDVPLLSRREIVAGAPRRNGDIFPFHRGACELQGQLSKLKIKDARREAINAVEKRANSMRRNEKRRQEHTRLYKKWFPVGC